MIRVGLFGLALLIGVPSPRAEAQELAGAGEAALQAALEDWLRGDEAAALPDLAALAAGGNAAARLLLGVINVTPALQGPWLMAQDRQTRIALLRRPDGGGTLSGRSWFQDPDSAQARAWAQSLQADAPMTVILDLARLGEPRAAAQAAFRQLSRQRRGFGDLATDSDYPPALRPYAALELGNPGALDPADPHRRLLGPVNIAPADLAGWLARNADAVTALCSVRCPDEPADLCGPAALAGLGGPVAVLHTGSPVEALVPSARFNRSPKGLEMMAALMQPEALAQADAPSACLTALVK